jgi:hypothetical protein
VPLGLPPDGQLNPVERAIALALGLAALVCGTVAVFRSGNQAGTAVLLAAALAFLLVGVQGAPLLRPDPAKLELARRRRIDRVLAELAAEPNPDVARGALAAAAAIEPAMAQALEAQEESLYAARVREALSRAGAAVEERAGPADLVAQRDSARPVLVVVVFRRRGPLYRRDVEAAAARLRGQATMGLLVVTNAALSGEVDPHLHEQPDRWTEVLTWNDGRDTDALTRALARAAR